jgi:glycosyltransferase involved in cell wall biosynthesis
MQGDPGRAMQKTIFDISAVAWHLKRIPEFSGIQRAVTLMIDRASRSLPAGSAYLGYLDKATNRYRLLPMDALIPGEIAEADRLRAMLGYPRPEAGQHPALRRYADRPAKYWFHRARFDLSALLGNERPFRKANTTLADWRRHRKPAVAARAPLQPIAFDDVASPGDRFVLLDSTFTVPRAEEIFVRARTKGLRIYTMLHDLIPIVMPQVSTDLGALNFHDWLHRTATYTTTYLANSHATGRDLSQFLATYGLDRPVAVIPLAQERLSDGPPAVLAGPLADGIDRAAYPALATMAGLDQRIRSVAAYPFVLCVGTLQVRKNIWRIATAWDRLRHEAGLPLPKLVFAGRRGWMIEDFDELMQATGNLGGWASVIEAPTDAELDFLYRSCSFTILASLYEGWGLPVGESLSYGKTAVVSAATSLPEVGGDLVEYCDPTSIDSIAAACRRLISDTQHRTQLEARIRAARLRSWDDVASDLLGAIRHDHPGFPS